MLERALTAVLMSALMILTGSLVVAPPAAEAAAKTYRIMPLGDSITRGGGQVNGRYVGYRLALQKQLKTGTFGAKFDFVGSMTDRGVPDGQHEGHGGWTIDNLAANIDRWMVTYRPDIVLLHAGTNNITRHDSPAVTAAKLRKLIAKIRSRNATTKIFVAKVIKSRDPARRPATNVYQSLIPAVVAASGPNVYLVDQSTVSATDLYDWTHPNDFGYLKMAYNFYQALNKVLGGGDWWPMTSPYRAKTATICQIHYSIGGKRVCRRSPVN
jgi:lysophospholipase L1-like esterase